MIYVAVIQVNKEHEVAIISKSKEINGQHNFYYQITRSWDNGIHWSVDTDNQSKCLTNLNSSNFVEKQNHSNSDEYIYRKMRSEGHDDHTDCRKMTLI